MRVFFVFLLPQDVHSLDQEIQTSAQTLDMRLYMRLVENVLGCQNLLTSIIQHIYPLQTLKLFLQKICSVKHFKSDGRIGRINTESACSLYFHKSSS